MMLVDGSQGEGGGQILRTALALAASGGREVRIVNIRARRPRPGLRPQHLTAVQALARITQAEVSGATPGSENLTFRPRGIYPGTYLFDVAATVRSAGSVALVAQAILPVLALASKPSQVILRGGTHVPWSPTVHYLQEVFLPAVAEVGVRATAALRAWGWYPQGQGEMLLTVQPAAALNPVTWLTPPRQEDFQAISALANVARHVGPRQREQLRRGLGWEVPVEEVVAGGAGRGSLVFLWGQHAGFTGLGAKGKPAETVADEVAQAWQAFQARQAALDRHLADQVVLYLVRAPGASRYTTEAITPHLLTNIAVIRDLAGASIAVQGEVGEPGTVICYGKPS